MSQSTEPTVAISLTCKSASDAIAFYTKAFGAQELYRLGGPNGPVYHAEFMIGNTRVYISDESPESHALALPEGGSSPCSFSIEVEVCHEAFAKAVEAGATPLNEPHDQFWGRRTAMIRDPFGYRWSFGQTLEVLSPEEIMKRAQNLF
jgi:PhnB protein